MTDLLPLTRSIEISAVPPAGTSRQVVASDTERQALAKTLDILSVESLDAELAIVPWRTEGFAVTGQLRARVFQSCVVSLVPVEQEIDEPIDVRFVPAGSKLAAAYDSSGHAGPVDARDEDAPEVFSGHSIDLGTLVAEHLALALDPYPRAPGAALPVEFSSAEPEADSPFAVLEKLKSQGKTKR